MPKRKTRTHISIALVISFMIGVTVLVFFNPGKTPILVGEVDYKVEYKEGLYLDIYYPTKITSSKYPVLIYFHGGAWIMGRKEAINLDRLGNSINELRSNGYVVISPEYTLGNPSNSPFPDCIIDAYDVLDWIYTNAEALNFDVDNIGLMGESAGAHIAMMAANTDPKDFSLGIKKPTIQYVIDIYGPTDLKTLYHSENVDSLQSLLNKFPDKVKARLDITTTLLGFSPESDSTRANAFFKKYSPTSYLNSYSPAVLIIHGLDDIVVPCSQAQTFKEKLESLGVEHEFYLLEGVQHGFINASKNQKKEVSDLIVHFVTNHFSAAEENEALNFHEAINNKTNAPTITQNL